MPPASELLELLIAREGTGTEVVLVSGAVTTVTGVGWGYDIGRGPGEAHLCNDAEPTSRIAGFFSENDVLAVRDPRTGATLFSRDTSAGEC